MKEQPISPLEKQTRDGHLGHSGGYILVPVVAMLAVVAAVSFLLNFEGAMGADTAMRNFEHRQARAVAEAGYREAQWQLSQNTSCAGYSNPPATSFGQHSYNVNITPVSGSPVTLTATGVLSTGARSILQRPTRAYQAPTAIVLQPDAADGKDTYLYKWKSAWNYGTDATLLVSNKWADSLANSLVSFDLSSIPAEAHVVNAVLDLHQGSPSADGGLVGVRQVTSAWTEGTFGGGTGVSNWSQSDVGVAWGALGGDFAAAPQATVSLPSGTVGWFQWDVTSLVSGWVQGSANHGLALVPENPNTDVDFDSSDRSDPTHRPKLTITYACECDEVCSVPGMAPSTIILSTDTSASLGGLSFNSDDLADYDPAGDTATLFFDGSLISGWSTNIDAVHVLADGHIILSTDNNETLGGLSFSQEDLVQYDPVADSATLYFDGALFSVASNLAAAHVNDGGGGVAPPPLPECDGTFRDEFNAVSYAGSDGTLGWATDWLEINESDGPGSSDEQVLSDLSDFRLRVRDNDGGGEGVQRQADLSTFASATLSFDYRRSSLDSGSDYVALELSSDGGASWTEIYRFEGDGTDSTYQNTSFDITPYIASNTRVRFVSSSSLGRYDQVYFDNVEICADN